MARKHRVSEVFRKDMRFRVPNPYRNVGKYPSDTECPGCGLVFQDGVWRQTVIDPSHPLYRKLCPACLQIRDDYPGGVLQISGSFLDLHRDQIVHRIRNLERLVREEHPLDRIMRIDERPREIVVYATAEHLVARIGKALRRDFKGTLEIQYAHETKFAAVHWSREEESDSHRRAPQTGGGASSPAQSARK